MCALYSLFFLLNNLVHVFTGRLDELNESNNPKDSGEDGDNNDVDNDPNVVDPLSVGMILI